MTKWRAFLRGMGRAFDLSGSGYRRDRPPMKLRTFADDAKAIKGDFDRAMNPEPSPGEDWCEWHHRSEPIPPDGAFWVCGECWHCWPTADDFITDVRQMLVEIGSPPRDELTLKAWPYCPLCSHDF